MLKVKHLECGRILNINLWHHFYASAFRRWKHYVLGLSIRPSVHLSVCLSEAWNTLFPPVHWSVGPSDQPWSFCGMSICPSVCLFIRPKRFLGICQRTHGGKGLKFCMLMYLSQLQNWLDYGHGLLIFFLSAPLWLTETGQIQGFQAFARKSIEGMAWNFACWCILTTSRTEYVLLIFQILALFWFSQMGKIWVSGHFPENAWRE